MENERMTKAESSDQAQITHANPHYEDADSYSTF